MNKNTDQNFLCVNLSLVCHGNRLVLQQKTIALKSQPLTCRTFVCLPPSETCQNVGRIQKATLHYITLQYSTMQCSTHAHTHNLHPYT